MLFEHDCPRVPGIGFAPVIQLLASYRRAQLSCRGREFAKGSIGLSRRWYHEHEADMRLGILPCFGDD